MDCDDDFEEGEGRYQGTSLSVEGTNPLCFGGCIMEVSSVYPTCLMVTTTLSETQDTAGIPDRCTPILILLYSKVQ